MYKLVDIQLRVMVVYPVETSITYFAVCI